MKQVCKPFVMLLVTLLPVSAFAQLPLQPDREGVPTLPVQPDDAVGEIPDPPAVLPATGVIDPVIDRLRSQLPESPADPVVIDPLAETVARPPRLQSTACTLAGTADIALNFGQLTPGERSEVSAVSQPMMVVCKRPGRYRFELVDADGTPLGDSVLPAAIVQSDGRRAPAALLLTVDGKPLRQWRANDGRLPEHHNLTVELRHASGRPQVPGRAGRLDFAGPPPQLRLVDDSAMTSAIRLPN